MNANNNAKQMTREQTRINNVSLELMFSYLIKGKIEKEIITSGEDGYPEEIEFDIEESWLCGVGGGMTIGSGQQILQSVSGQMLHRFLRLSMKGIGMMICMK